MVAYCNDCNRYVNQYCEICSGNFGVQLCDRYGCGGRMLCPICGGNNLSQKREPTPDPYDFKRQKDRTVSPKGAHSDIEARYFAERMQKEATPPKPTQSLKRSERHCPLCGYDLNDTWKFCPECGVSLIKR
jgi:hypothetical protein